MYKQTDGGDDRRPLITDTNKQKKMNILKEISQKSYVTMQLNDLANYLDYRQKHLANTEQILLQGIEVELR